MSNVGAGQATICAESIGEPASIKSVHRIGRAKMDNRSNVNGHSSIR
jgi:hypothetical protein